MTRSVYSYVLFLLLASACESKPSHGIGLQTLDNSTNAVDVARRDIENACTPSGTSGTIYSCYNRGYIQVPKTEWLTTTTIISLFGNDITFIPVNEFDGLTLLWRLWLDGNKITSVPVGMVDTNIALVELWLSGNPLQCSEQNSWNPATTISSICTSCTEGTAQTVPCGSLQIDFRQCDSKCVSEPNSESPTVSPTVAPTPKPTPNPTATKQGKSKKGKSKKGKSKKGKKNEAKKSKHGKNKATKGN